MLCLCRNDMYYVRMHAGAVLGTLNMVCCRKSRPKERCELLSPLPTPTTENNGLKNPKPQCAKHRRIIAAANQKLAREAAGDLLQNALRCVVEFGDRGDDDDVRRRKYR